MLFKGTGLMNGLYSSIFNDDLCVELNERASLVYTRPAINIYHLFMKVTIARVPTLLILLPLSKFQLQDLLRYVFMNETSCKAPTQERIYIYYQI
jgi:hypothetical protein